MSQQGLAQRTGERHVGGQVLTLAAQTVAEPAAQRWAAGSDASRIERVHGLAMVVDTCAHRADEADVVGNRTEMRQQLGNLHPALSALEEFERAGEDL